jgi:low affinity Fe/Cu permease
MNIFKNKNFLVIFLSVIVFITIFLIQNFFISIDKFLTYIYVDYKNSHTDFSNSLDKIVVVHLDERSLKKL